MRQEVARLMSNMIPVSILTSHSCMASANFIGHSQVSVVKNPALWTLAILLAFEAEIPAVFVDL